MRCPHCDKAISQVGLLHMKLDSISRFFPEDIQDMANELIRKSQHFEKMILGLMELSYRRGGGDEPVDDSILKEVISSLEE